MEKKPIFKTDIIEKFNPIDPETLFHNLRGRAEAIKHLWSHQADILRAYYKDWQQSKDIAIELPTGAGKTLVGLLIGEWRRQTFGNRVAYLCPTRQLAKQVGAKARDYGIQAYVLIGKQSDYPPQEFSAYQSNRAIAITTYSSIFNIKPRINDAQTLILDDAHAGENFIANMWSVEISRFKLPSIYTAIVRLLSRDLNSGFYADIISEWDPRKAALIDLVPATSFRKHEESIRDLLDVHLEEETPPRYAWDIIKDHLAACNLYISWDSILIRPFIPPSLTHSFFEKASQRVYMSATLGAGGELERISGISSIARLPLPTGWDKRGNGRRLFLMPEIELPKEEMYKVLEAALHKFDRSLILTPSQYDADSIMLVNKMEEWGIEILRAPEIEESIEPFLAKKQAALLLSRYDGLDLPGEACRLLIFGGLPTGTNLQEKFLWSRISAFSLLRDRIITRFTQGVGRCTRSDNDYAVVFLFGRQLIDFLLKNENLRIMNPELQAELEFGINNSMDKKSEDFKELWEAFLIKDDDWNHAETTIISLRDSYSRQNDPTSEKLNSIVSNEVKYLYAMWNGNFEIALENARKVADSLGGDETKAYRAWWCYLSAEVSMILFEKTKNQIHEKTAKDLLQIASNLCFGVSWFSRLYSLDMRKKEKIEIDNLTNIAVENIRENLVKLGAIGKRFERSISRIGENLKSVEYKQYHQGLKGLGEILGFRAEIPKGDGAPDCLWSISNLIYIVHEAKTDHTPSDPIGINDVRQAQSHEKWVISKKSCKDRNKILSIIISPRMTIAPEVPVYAESLYHVTPDEMVKLYEKAAGILRRVRSKITEMKEEKILEELYNELDNTDLSPKKIRSLFSRRLVKEMEIFKNKEKTTTI